MCIHICIDLTYLSRVSVDQVENGAIVRLPGHDPMETFPLDFVQHELQQVHFYGLLNEHDVVLRHGWRGRKNTHQRMMAAEVAQHI